MNPMHALLLAFMIAADGDPHDRRRPTVEHVMVYHEPGRFGGWPANHGIWSWRSPPPETHRDEILVGFSAGYHKDLGPERHNIDHEKPEEHLLARSLDGGKTWAIENPARQGALIGTAGMRHGTVPPGFTEPEPVDCPGGIDFTHAEFAMTCRMAGVDGGTSRLYYSYDRGHTWKGPFRLPLFGQPGIAARTDYVVSGPQECLLFLTASKSNHREGRPICARTTDGGKTWAFVGCVGPEPAGYAIMPSTVRIGPRRLLTTLRRAEGQPKRSWIEAWASADEGKSWSLLNEPVPDTGEGNPPHVIRLGDGRLCLTYGGPTRATTTIGKTRKRQASASRKTANLGHPPLNTRSGAWTALPQGSVGQVLFWCAPWRGCLERPWIGAPFFVGVVGSQGNQVPLGSRSPSTCVVRERHGGGKRASISRRHDPRPLPRHAPKGPSARRATRPRHTFRRFV